MLKAPEVPTDNLYKFLAIFGLVIFIFSIYALIETQNRFYGSLKKYTDDHNEILNNDTKRLSQRLYLEDKIDFKRQKLKVLYNWSGSVSEKDLAKLFKSDLQFENDLNELKKMQLDLNLLNDDEANSKRMKELISDEQKNGYLTLIFILMATGVFLIPVGFFLWYYKTQIHLDRQMKKE